MSKQDQPPVGFFKKLSLSLKTDLINQSNDFFNEHLKEIVELEESIEAGQFRGAEASPEELARLMASKGKTICEVGKVIYAQKIERLFQLIR